MAVPPDLELTGARIGRRDLLRLAAGGVGALYLFGCSPTVSQLRLSDRPRWVAHARPSPRRARPLPRQWHEWTRRPEPGWGGPVGHPVEFRGPFGVRGRRAADRDPRPAKRLRARGGHGGVHVALRPRRPLFAVLDGRYPAELAELPTRHPRRATWVGRCRSRPSSRAATRAAGPTLTSRSVPTSLTRQTCATRSRPRSLALPEAACNEVYGVQGYESSVGNLERVSLASDGVFRDGVDRQLATMTGNASAGFSARLTVAV